jgi:hypothetical protein
MSAPFLDGDDGDFDPFVALTSFAPPAHGGDLWCDLRVECRALADGEGDDVSLAWRLRDVLDRLEAAGELHVR